MTVSDSARKGWCGLYPVGVHEDHRNEGTIAVGANRRCTRVCAAPTARSPVELLRSADLRLGLALRSRTGRGIQLRGFEC